MGILQLEFYKDKVLKGNNAAMQDGAAGYTFFVFFQVFIIRSGLFCFRLSSGRSGYDCHENANQLEISRLPQEWLDVSLFWAGTKSSGLVMTEWTNGYTGLENYPLSLSACGYQIGQLLPVEHACMLTTITTTESLNGKTTQTIQTDFSFRGSKWRTGLIVSRPAWKWLSPPPPTPLRWTTLPRVGNVRIWEGLKEEGKSRERAVAHLTISSRYEGRGQGRILFDKDDSLVSLFLTWVSLNCRAGKVWDAGFACGSHSSQEDAVHGII